MRGRFRWLEHRGTVCNGVVSIAALRIAERPPHPRSLRSLDLSPHPKSDVSDFGHLILPNSGTPEFGGERFHIGNRPLNHPLYGRF